MIRSMRAAIWGAPSSAPFVGLPPTDRLCFAGRPVRVSYQEHADEIRRMVLRTLVDPHDRLRSDHVSACGDSEPGAMFLYVKGLVCWR